jgi:hypothetical protein
MRGVETWGFAIGRWAYQAKKEEQINVVLFVA